MNTEAPPLSPPFVSEDLPSWQLQEAKNRFSAVVKAATHGPAQLVTVHGVVAAVVMSPQEYERLQKAASPGQRLSQALRSPLLDEEDLGIFDRDQRASLSRDLTL